MDVRPLLQQVAEEAGDWFEALPERPVHVEAATPVITDVLGDDPVPPRSCSTTSSATSTAG